MTRSDDDSKNKLSRHFLLLFVRNTGGFSVIGEKREFRFLKFFRHTQFR